MQNKLSKIMESHQNSLIWCVVVTIIIFVFVSYQAEWTGFSGRTLWDWLGLLVVPSVLAVGGYSFNRAENARQRNAASEQAQDATLQAYLGYMGKLMLEHRLRDSVEEDEAQMVSRARTVATLEALGARRKASLLKFLYESDLLTRNCPIVKLTGARLEFARLSRAQLSGSDLSRTVLVRADLRGASLRNVDLSCSVLSHADLGHVPQTVGDQIREGPAFGTTLHSTKAYVTSHEELTSITYIGTDLRGAVLRGAVMRSTNLHNAVFEGADLTDADLTEADLTGANVSEEQLKTCKLLTGAIMPDGSKYERPRMSPTIDRGLDYKRR